MAEDEITGAENQLCEGQKAKPKFKSKKEEEEEEIPYLAVELVINILLRLPANLLVRCRQVCRSWCEVIDSLSFAHKHQASYHMEEFRVVYYETRSHDKNLYLLNIDEPNYSFRRIRVHPMIADSHMLCWLDYIGYGLFYVFCNGQTFLYNPIRGQMLILPLTLLSTSYGLGFDNATNTYKLVNVLLLEGKYWIQVYTLGTSSWRQISAVPPCEFDWHLAPVPAYGDVHWGSKNLIVSFDLKKEEFKSTPLPYRDRFQETRDYKLFDFRGALAVVYESYSFSSYSAIWVLKDYDNNSRWAKDYNIRPALSSRYVLQVTAWNDGMIIGKGENLFYYDPKSDGLTTLDNEGFRYVNGSEMRNYTGNLISLKNYGDLA
ncbi:putative F-box protein [Tripterygium wilfordii]|uniref:Putative F-box protein n=1 Tax=Tripterygium wilfordii TaxID=458696 RepID=A0A7J7CFS4_TRIWF|nr:F-box/kelch-repeat protein At3g06240-like [Tripterygium wilfordii]KAF5732586.1 putative F-box protein [Tripterygium wilfordii]